MIDQIMGVVFMLVLLFIALTPLWCEAIMFPETFTKPYRQFLLWLKSLRNR